MGYSVYVHVPFCRTRCNYCAFYSGEPLDRLPAYAPAVAAEAALRPPGPAPADTVYFGGGTPTLLGPGGIAGILSAIDVAWGLTADAEITVEANPGIHADLPGLRVAGANRLSLGIQCLDDRLLRLLGRPHTAAQALSALEAATRTGFPDLSADLLFGLPGISPAQLASWAHTVATAGATHVSSYSLELHAGTRLALSHSRGMFRPASDLEEHAQWQALEEALTGDGFTAYEVSNYALPGAECRHNLCYWAGGAYVGLGPGAHGFAPGEGPWGTRRWNSPGLERYLSRLASGRPPHESQETLTASEALLERLFLALRQPRAFDLEQLCRTHGVPPHEVSARASRAAAEGLLRPATRLLDGNWVPTPRGLRSADGLALWIFEATSPSPSRRVCLPP